MLVLEWELYARMFWCKVITLHSIAYCNLLSPPPNSPEPTLKTLMPYYSLLILLFSSKQSFSYHSPSLTHRRQDQDPGRDDCQADRDGGGLHWGGQQPLHLPSPARVYRLWPGPDIPTLWEYCVGQGLHWQADKPLKMFRWVYLKFNPFFLYLFT